MVLDANLYQYKCYFVDLYDDIVLSVTKLEMPGMAWRTYFELICEIAIIVNPILHFFLF